VTEIREEPIIQGSKHGGAINELLHPNRNKPRFPSLLMHPQHAFDLFPQQVDESWAPFRNIEQALDPLRRSLSQLLQWQN
jgi:hypothetical protein